jgi:putative hydrolase of the HAD superfamily
MAARDPIGFVLFDLGGVLVDPGGVEPMRLLSGLASEEEVWTRWLECRWVRRFESGSCSPEEFAAGVVSDWDLDVEPAAFLELFGSWPGDPYPGALELVTSVARSVPIGFLSNTNAVQWSTNYEGTPLIEAFEYRFVSFDLGMVKPDLRTFGTVADRLPLPAERVLFLDDNAVNVDGATSAGFVGRHARGIDEARAVLAEEGFPVG